MSSDIVSSYNFSVRCFDAKNRLVLLSSVFEKWALKVWSIIGGNTLKSFPCDIINAISGKQTISDLDDLQATKMDLILIHGRSRQYKETF